MYNNPNQTLKSNRRVLNPCTIVVWQFIQRRGIKKSRRNTYKTSNEDLCAIEDAVHNIPKAAEKLEKVEIEFHLQLSCVDSIFQLMVLAGLVVHRSVGRVEDKRNVEFRLVSLPHKEQ